VYSENGGRDGSVSRACCQVVEACRLGYACSTRAGMVPLAAQLSLWLGMHHISLAELTVAFVEQFLREQSSACDACSRSMNRLLEMLSSAGVLPEEPAAAPTSASDVPLDRSPAMREERGLADLTVDAYVSDVGRFLEHCGRRDLRDLAAGHIGQAVLSESADRSPASVRRYAVALRSFLRFCRLSGVVEADLSSSALPVSGRRRSLLPQG
jgi:integrase/recombinase XerD